MLDRGNSNVTERVRLWSEHCLPSGLSSGLIGHDDDLGENGLSSLDFVNLMLAVEAEFDLKIPELDMRPTNFRSIARIETLVEEPDAPRRSGGGGTP